MLINSIMSPRINSPLALPPLSKRMFEKWYSVIFITLLPPFPLVKGGNNKNPVPSPLQGEG
ncbi:hypothetical protein ANA_C10930 [Anabaena sp. 90]|nr:hypothetical protein ANA_C10930 [Anabaena sp. 90]